MATHKSLNRSYNTTTNNKDDDDDDDDNFFYNLSLHLISLDNLHMTRRKKKNDKKTMIHRQEFEDKLMTELIKIVPYNLQTSIRLSLFSKDVKVEQSFNSGRNSGSLFHKLAALNNTGLSEISGNITIFRHTCDGI